MGTNYSARLIKLMYLKVGDHVVQLAEPSVSTTDFGVPSSAHPAPQHPVHQAQENSGFAVQATPLFEQPPVVQLSKDDPDFIANKDRLMGMGYRWASGPKLWILPNVTLNPQFQGFKAQGQQLQAWGFVNPLFDGLNWEFPLKQQQPRDAQQAYQGNGQNNGQRQGNRGNGNYQGKRQEGYKKQGNGGRNGYQSQKAQNYRQDYQH